MKTFFAKIWAFIESMFSKLVGEVKKYTPIAVNLVEGIKKTVESGTFNTLLEVVKFAIPGDTDDKIIDKVMEVAKEYVPKVAVQLNIIESITDIEDVNDQMIAVVHALKGLNPEDQSDYWHELAAFVLRKLADGKITLGEAGSIAEYHYQNYIKNR